MAKGDHHVPLYWRSGMANERNVSTKTAVLLNACPEKGNHEMIRGVPLY